MLYDSRKRPGCRGRYSELTVNDLVHVLTFGVPNGTIIHGGTVTDGKFGGALQDFCWVQDAAVSYGHNRYPRTLLLTKRKK